VYFASSAIFYSLATIMEKKSEILESQKIELKRTTTSLISNENSNTIKSIKKRIHLILNTTEDETLLGKAVNIFLIILIVGNVLAVVIETVEPIYSKYNSYFFAFEVFSVSIFTVEYLLRLWSCTIEKKYKSIYIGRFKFILSSGSIIDLLAISPFYLPIFAGFDLRFIRMFRLIRFLRFLKLSRYLKASQVISRVFSSKKEELILSIMMTLLLIIVASSLMYFIENNAQPENFSSIPETMWWAVATLTTVGYGDVIPITPLGKIMTGIISILGVGLFALPAGILASAFADEYRKDKVNKVCCPNCGKEI
jgi:voltage-gated potassium channel